MKAILPLLLFVIAITYRTWGQTTDPEFNATYAAKLQEVLDDMGPSANIRGLSAAVVVPGQGQWIGTYGNALPGQAIQSDMRFCMASNSKLFVAVLCLKLQDEGLLSLDDAVSEWLPPHPHVNPNITIRQLLSHQSGIFDFYNDASSSTLNQYENNPDSLWSPEDVLATIGAPIYQPGETYYYSNTNFLLAQMCCAAAADTNFGYLLKSRIIEPLELGQTAYPADGDNVFEHPWAMLYSGSSQALSPNEANGFNSFIQSAGGIWSTPADMVKWYQSIFLSDLLSDEALEQLRRIEPWSSYSLGLRAQNRHGATLRYHAGAWGYRSWCAFDERTGITIAICGNSQGKSVSGIGEKLLETALAELPLLPLNLTLTELISPHSGRVCQPADSVRLLVKNTGAWTVSDMQYEGFANHESVGIFQHTFTPALQSGESRVIAFPLSISAEGRYHFEAQIEIINNPFAGEEYFFDNKKSASFIIKEEADFEWFEYDETLNLPYGTLPDNWVSNQADNPMDWRVSRFIDYEDFFSNINGTICKNNYEDGNIGEEYLLDLPMQLRFSYSETDTNTVYVMKALEYAYALYPGYYGDTLELQYSLDCGITFESAWKAGGEQLSTAPATTSPFIPVGLQDWRLDIVNIPIIKNKDCIFRIRTVSGFGNNIWLREADGFWVESVRNAVAPTFSLAPNPTSNSVEVSFNESVSHATVYLHNILGHQVWVKKDISGNQLTINRGSLPAGAYILNVKEPGKKHPPAKVWIVD